MADSFDHCEALVRAGDKDRFLATLFAPQKYRRALFALYAFNLEVARTRELAREPMPGEIRLQWWRDVLGGAGRGEVDAHPVAAALRDVVGALPAAAADAVDLIDARAFDLYDEPMASLSYLERYAAQTSSALIELAARILADGRDLGTGDLDAACRHRLCHRRAAARAADPCRARPALSAGRSDAAPRRAIGRCVRREGHDRTARRAGGVAAAGAASSRRRARPAQRRARRRSRPRCCRSRWCGPRSTAWSGAAISRSARAELPQWRRQWTLWRAARERPAQGVLSLFRREACAADPVIEIGERAGADRAPFGDGLFGAAQPRAVGMLARASAPAAGTGRN